MTLCDTQFLFFFGEGLDVWRNLMDRMKLGFPNQYSTHILDYLSVTSKLGIKISNFYNYHMFRDYFFIFRDQIDIIKD